MALPSIQRRLSLSLLVVSLAGAVAVAAAVAAVVRHEVQEVMDDTLAEAAEVLHNTLAWARPLAAAAGPSAGALPSTQHEEHVVWQLLDGDGRVLLHSHLAPRQPLVHGLTQGFAEVPGAWRVHAMPLAFEPGTLLVAQPQRERDEAVQETTLYAACVAFVIGMACALWLRLNVRRELRPLDRLSAAVAAYDPTRGDGRLGAAERAELAPMHAAIEHLGRRLNQRLRHERAFAAHAAHALRTPLAGLVVQMKLAERHSAPEGQAALGRARSAADRLGRVVSALLALFRSGHELQWQPVDLAALVRELPSAGLVVTVAPAPPIQADADLLAAALANLLDNAVRHGARRLWIRTQTDPGGVRLRLQDDGPGMTAERRVALQAALDDADEPDRPEGPGSPATERGANGLGLKMADWVARAHGGRLRLLPAEAGCLVELSLGTP